MADFSTVARPYARAVFDLASAGAELRGWSEALQAAAGVLSDAGAKNFLARPELDDQQRAEFVQSVCQSVNGADVWGSQAGRNLLRILVENDRLTAVPEISAQFDALKAHAENTIKVTLVSAVEVDRSVADKVTQALQKKLGRTVALECEIDPALLGGAIIRAEDMVIDGSVRTRLQRLAENLIG